MEAVAQASGPWARRRYPVTAVLVWLAVAVQQANQQWSSDMWLHVAVVRELARRPFDPTHPQVLADVGHPMFSPYTLAVGLLSRATGLAPTAALALAGLCSVAAVLVLLPRVVHLLTDNARAPFWALLFVLFAWGPDPWRWSGFLGANAIGFVAPYPSTFAVAMSLAGIVAFDAWARGPGRRWPLLAALVACAALATLAHPLTAIWLAVALAALAPTRLGRRPRRWAAAAAAGLLAAVLVAAWPLWSPGDMAAVTDQYDRVADTFYRDVWWRLAPALPGAAVIAWRSWRRPLDPLGLLLAGGLVVYVAGGMTGHEAYGRIVSFLAVVCQIGLADGVGRLEARAGAPEGRATRVAAWAGVATILGVGVVTTAPGTIRTVPAALLPDRITGDPAWRTPDGPYRFLAGVVGPDEVVAVRGVEGNRVVPAVTGRVLLPGWEAGLVDDVPERRADLDRLLARDATAAERAEARARHPVDWVLLDVGEVDLRRSLEADGAVAVAEDGPLVLLRLPAP